MGVQEKTFLLLTVLSICKYAWTSNFMTVKTIGDSNTILQKIRQYNESNDLYVGGPNKLFQLSADLEVLFEVVTGPTNDNRHCLPEPDVCEDYERKPTANNISVLEIDHSKKKLLVCGTGAQGLCHMHSLVNITKKQTMVHDAITNFVGSGTSSEVFFKVSNNENFLYVMQSYDDRSLDYSPLFLSTRRITQLPQGRGYNITYKEYDAESEVFSGLDIDIDLKPTYYMKALLSFSYKEHGFFLMEQQKLEGNPNQFVIKLGRICFDDPVYYSYTEIELQCNYGIPVYRYNVVTTALVEGKFLYYAAGRASKDSRDYNPDSGSALCVFNLDELNSYIEEKSILCYENGEGYRPFWIFNRDKSVRKCKQQELIVKNIQENTFAFCGTSYNRGIEIEKPFYQNKAIYGNEQIIITAIQPVVQNGLDYIIIGTKDGHVMKIIENMERMKYKEFLNVKISNSSISSSLILNSNKLYLLSGNKVIKFLIDTCSVHQDCDSCLSSRDPLGCGWCKDQCLTATNCMKIGGESNRNKCPPSLYSIYPLNGPTTGGTILTLEGQNFGGPSSTLTVKLSNVNCKVIAWNTSSLTCTTQPASGPQTSTVQLNVLDQMLTGERNYNVDGSVYSTQHFSYKETVVSMFEPTYGPVAGGTDISIRGENLDIGLNRSVSVAYDFNCEIFNLTSDLINCKTVPWNKTSGFIDRQRRSVDTDAKGRGPLRLTIDGAEFTSDAMENSNFYYLPNPVISQINPRKAFRSGGIPLIVQGKHLDSVAMPYLRASIGNEDIADKQLCTVNPGGESMTCPSLDVRSVIVDIDPNDPAEVNIWFVMDGVSDLRNFHQTQGDLSSMTYYPDPDFDSFPGIGNGRNFQGFSKSDVKVIINGKLCNVTDIKTNSLVCSPGNKPKQVDPDNQDKLKVQVTVGNLVFDIGFLVYTMTSDAGSTMIIVLGLIIALVVIAVIIILLIMKKKRLGFFKPRLDDRSIRYTQGDQIGIEGFAPAEGITYNLENRQNNYTERGAMEQISATDLIDDDLLALITNENLLIGSEHLMKTDILGQGNFGCVYKGFLTTPDEKGDKLVAVKTLHHIKTNSLVCSPGNKPKQVDPDNQDKLKVQVTVGNLVFDIGFLVYTMTSDAGSTMIIVLGLIIALVVIAVIIILLIMKKKRLGFFKPRLDDRSIRYTQGDQIGIEGFAPAEGITYNLENRQNNYTERGAMEQISATDLIDDDLLALITNENLLIGSEHLMKTDILGQGNFGCVYKGFLTTPDEKGDKLVAVKTLH
ncbi:hypothetical protein LOTGIDRAFT_168736, partial [Lottia gigantea]